MGWNEDVKELCIFLALTLLLIIVIFFICWIMAICTKASDSKKAEQKEKTMKDNYLKTAKSIVRNLSKIPPHRVSPLIEKSPEKTQLEKLFCDKFVRGDMLICSALIIRRLLMLSCQSDYAFMRFDNELIPAIEEELKRSGAVTSQSEIMDMVDSRCLLYNDIFIRNLNKDLNETIHEVEETLRDLIVQYFFSHRKNLNITPDSFKKLPIVVISILKDVEIRAAITAHVSEAIKVCKPEILKGLR